MTGSDTESSGIRKRDTSDKVSAALMWTWVSPVALPPRLTTKFQYRDTFQDRRKGKGHKYGFFILTAPRAQSGVAVM